MTAFHETVLGRRFLEHTVPSAVREIGRLADQVGELTSVLRGREPATVGERRHEGVDVGAASATSASSPCVLIVDDDPLCRSGLARALKPTCRVVQAGSAEEALEVLASTPVDVVLTDFNMPGHDGLWLLDQARSTRAGARRVLMSGQEIPNAPELVERGALHAFVAKPTAHDALVAALGMQGS
jgi:CheY-like chemotaxis protein